MKKTVIAAAFVCCVLFVAPAFAEELKEADPVRVAGYYRACENEDPVDFLLLSDGTAYSKPGSSAELEGPYDYAAYGIGDDYLISLDEDGYVYLKWQREKGKTENGGRYYAVYADYAGRESDIGCREGRQIEFSGYVFGNDYDVYDRESLTAFFGIDVTDGSGGRVEGGGYDTPEEAVSAYINGLKNNDIDEMMSTFAVESYAEHYSLIAMVERMTVYQPNIGYIPNISDYSIRLNLEKRRSDITNVIRGQYLNLTDSKSVKGEYAGNIVRLNDFDSAEDLVETIFAVDDSSCLSDIRFENDFIDPASLIDNYDTERNRENMLTRGAIFGAEDVVSVIAKFYCNGKPALFMPDAVKLDGKWYLDTVQTVPSMLGLYFYAYGTVVFPNERAYEQFLRGDLDLEELETETEW